ncbi:MAG: rubrerythrin [Candidatus Handelsmanbacteria bacterium]|nr:rubrerythrin [Candidatus Handelsmanbacteria bacterium]
MAKSKRAAQVREKLVRDLITSYNMEVETVLNFLCHSINLDGVRAEEIKKSLTAEIQSELSHATLLGKRIKVLGGQVPGSMELKARQASLQAQEDTTDVEAVIKGVIEAEEAAIEQYQKIIELSDRADYVTQELAIQLKGDEEDHRQLFVGFLKEYTRLRGNI